ncbi:DUF1801 domain-containing protein [Rhodobacteraceae bacterium RKSG542]|uniref:DUF1801 domain-containing protein n=1 Tax=Pseudovibrio flavus TaxID=2529854 RepID=UPI0012BCE446|nr:DUF1801 domain-containing protein [Pseudovibrio flavus]MTI18195.1 DUF1801 domain-containing protein [Pseudovibrio flavus]
MKTDVKELSADLRDLLQQELDRVISEVAPNASRRAMYGGFVFELIPQTSKTMVCGHFAYKAHVSLELSKGAELEDAFGFLEGSGKLRRHIKLNSLADIEDKKVADYLRLAFAKAEKELSDIVSS